MLGRIGIHVSDLGVGIRRGLERASEFGVVAVQLDASGELDPRELGRSGRRDVARLLQRHDLALGALGAAAGAGLADAEANNRIVPALVARCELARDLGTRTLALPLGRIPDEADSPARAAIAEGLADVLRAAEANGIVVAADAGTESPETLRRFLEATGNHALAAAIDPGTFAIHGFSPVEATRTLAPWIRHAYLRDGALGRGEADVGRGDVPWREYLAELAGAAYDGYQIVRSGAGANRLESMRDALAYLGRV